MNRIETPFAAVSIVSHGHGGMVVSLVDALLRFPEVQQIIVTRNVPERLDLVANGRVSVVDNPMAKGFGANHNEAFAKCGQPMFCVLNPDIELRCNPFPGVVRLLERTDIGLAAPLVQAPDGAIEDSARYFPTLYSLGRKILLGEEGRYVTKGGERVFYPDWVAGMFMLFRSSVFRRLGGFDEEFFLYYEDVDICARVWQHGMKVALCTECAVVHDARRDSRHSLRHLQWHARSALRYFWKYRGGLSRPR